jgi:hypothetical protein
MGVQHATEVLVGQSAHLGAIGQAQAPLAHGDGGSCGGWLGLRGFDRSREVGDAGWFGAGFIEAAAEVLDIDHIGMGTRRICIARFGFGRQVDRL